MTAILGGGLSGLSAAYYALENPRLGSIVLLEASNRLGGWVSTKKSPNGSIFEQGPRTIRPRGEAGENTLHLVDALNLDDKIIPIPVTHPAALNRYIYVEEKLHILPVSMKPLLFTCPPFKRPLFKAVWNELRTPRVTSIDESVYNFVERRIGRDVADYIISPLICGICAGDAKQISVKFLMPLLFEAEQMYGSIFQGIVKGGLLNKLGPSKVEKKSSKELHEMDLVDLSKKSNWAIWSLEGGLEQLPQALANNLYSRNTHIRLGTECKELTFHSDCVELRAGVETKKYERIISSLPAKCLAPLVKNQHPDLAKELEAIPTVTVGLVNFEFPGQVLSMTGFGLLVPPQEELPILGIIFDSCIIPQENTVSTFLKNKSFLVNFDFIN